jgi:hypothetical protein
VAPGHRGTSKVQFAKEATPGTAITTATALWRGSGGFLSDDRDVEMTDEMIGIFDGADRSSIPKIDASLKLEKTPATFEQLQYLFVMGLGGPFAGSADGTGSTGFTYTTAIPTNAVPTNTAYTFQTGDEVEAEYATYNKVTQIDLEGEQGKEVMMSGSLIAQQVLRLSGGLTAGVTIPAVENMLQGTGKLYLDAIAGAYGTTQISQQVLAWKLGIKITWEKKYTMDGQLYWTFAVFGGKEITGEITFEHDATSVVGVAGEKVNWKNQLPRLLSLRFAGSAYATPGTAGNGKRVFWINLPIKWTKFNALDEINGNNIIKAAFQSKYNTTAGNAGNFVVSNEISTLP